jgi:hypothetical protein
MDQVEKSNLPSEKKAWIVVSCRQGQEVRARVELERQGFEVYLPMRLVSIRRPGRQANGARDLLARPFLPGYLFCRVGLALDGFQFDEERLPFISGDGFYTTADYAALNTPLDSVVDGEAWIAELYQSHHR